MRRGLRAVASFASVALVAAAVVGVPRTLDAKEGKIVSVETATVAPGLEYARWEDPGVIVAHVVKMDLKSKTLRLRSFKSKGKESLRDLAARLEDSGTKVLAGVNGDYFRQTSEAGLPYGVQVADGRLIFGPMNRTMIGFGDGNEPFVGIATLKAKLSFAAPEERTKEKWISVNDVNEVEEEDKRKDGIYLYTPAFLGLNLNKPKGTIAVVETIVPALQVGDVCEGKISRVEASDVPVDVPENGCLLYFFGDSHRAIAKTLKPGRPVALKIELPPMPGNVTQAIGGGPRIVRDGKVSVEIAKEAFDSVYAMEISKRHPRSAVGFDRAKQFVYLVMVEGRHEKSRGMTFGEMGAFLVQLGCWQGMSFDGGGSAGLFLAERELVSQSMGGKNRPEERELANALLVTEVKPEAPPDPKDSKTPKAPEK